MRNTKSGALTALAVGAALAVAVPATADAAVSAPQGRTQARVACPSGFVCIYPSINFGGQPYVKRASDGSVKHLPDYIRSQGSSVINNSGRTARVYQKDNFHGRRVCVGRNGGSIHDLRSYQLNDSTHSLKNNNTACGG
ncbi:peptidase inhibitor family I36 protein [Streptomyces javensis]|uniref:Peptidase inhibitor family I36 protein n=1 Tax=Streptomyces javensis TaxID=114698 RepID=A0ABS0RA10_9ACTN|nr:peptidase inhibitor family I36 protein [Streptomyces javensis]MBI0313696.1 peptidase inhibitor family I36 protein [Streptomyces javensis]